MGSVFASNVVDRRLETSSCQPKNYEIGICCFSADHAVLMCKSKDYWFEIRIMSPRESAGISADWCFL